MTNDDRLRLFDVGRIEAILAPFARDPDRLVVILEDAAGQVIAASPPSTLPGMASVRRTWEVRPDGRMVGRLVATGAAAADPVVESAIAALAISLEQVLEVESHAVLAGDGSVGVGERTRSGLDADLAQARVQQRRLVSLLAPDVPGYDLASHYEAAREIGGDFFELFRLPHRRGHPLGIVIADVTGKGIAAALLMAFARPVMHTALGAATGPADALVRTNRVLVEEHRSALFITALCATLDLSTGRVRMANAGHEPPLLIPGDDKPIQQLPGAGALLGMFSSLDLVETVLDLRPGDVLVLYTDGVTDAVGPSGDRFGEPRLLAIIEAARGGSAHDVVASIRDAVAAFRQTVEPADDVTVVAIGRQRPR